MNSQHFLLYDKVGCLKTFVKVSYAAKINVVPSVYNVVVSFVGYVTVPQLGRSTLFIGVKFDGYNRWLILSVKIPLLHYLFVFFKLQVFTYNTAVPKAKLAARFGRHFSLFASPKLQRKRIGNSGINFLRRCVNAIVFLVIFHASKLTNMPFN